MGLAAQQRTVRAFLEQGEHLSQLLCSLRPAEFLRTVPGLDLSLHDVAADLLVRQTSLLTALDQPTTQRPSTLPDHCTGIGLGRHQSRVLAREIADHHTGPAIAAQFREAQQESVQRLSGPDLPEAVTVGRAVLRTRDLLRLLGLEWALHADDLNRALPTHRPIEIPRMALADAVRLLAEILRSRHPGHSVEIRVPPFAAVQCGRPGEPRHTRGTPPSVVECQPLAFLRLCRGRETFAEAARRHQLTASGVRADISEWLPLF